MEDSQYMEAEEIAVQAEVLEKCELHEEVYDPGGGDLQDAYKLGNYKFSRGEVASFGDRREMTDAIKAVVEQAAMECYTCAKWRDE
jgi:hypothetical protein